MIYRKLESYQPDEEFRREILLKRVDQKIKKTNRECNLDISDQNAEVTLICHSKSKCI